MHNRKVVLVYEAEMRRLKEKVAASGRAQPEGQREAATAIVEAADVLIVANRDLADGDGVDLFRLWRELAWLQDIRNRASAATQQ